MTEGKLKFCPFCKGKAKLSKPYWTKKELRTISLSPLVWVECKKCSCVLSGNTKQQAISAWNRRVG